MHYTVFAVAILFLTASTAPTVSAQTVELPSPVKHNNSSSQLTPANLVILAHRGYLKQQGIPSYSALSGAYNLKLISAEKIIQAAVKANRLSTDYLTNQSYLKAVAMQLETIENIR
jgi:hypothetical protein